MKKLIRFAWHYRMFSLASLTIIVGLILELSGLHTAAHWLLAIVSVVSLGPLLMGMWQDLREGTYGIDILAATAIIGAVALGEYWAGIVVVVMLTGGEALEHYAQHRARSELDSLLKHAPRKAYVLRKGKVIQVKVSEIHVGDKLVI